MNIRDIFITLRYKISYGSTVEWYNFWYIVLRKKRKIIPQVASIDETLQSQKSPVLENSFLSVRFLVGPFAGSGTKIL